MDTRKKILETAHKLFVMRGYTATSMRQIAAETGIGKATIYHHFKDKESIALEVVNNNSLNMMEDLKDISLVKGPIEKLRAAAEFSMRSLVGSAEIIQVVRREIPSCRTELQKSMSLFFGEYISMIKAVLLDGIESEVFREVDIDTAARVFLSMIQGTFASAYITGVKPVVPEKIVDGLMDVFLNGIMSK